MNEKNLTIECPDCGKDFTLTVKPNEDEKMHKNKAAERIAMLKAAGVDVTNLYAITAADGAESVARLADGKLNFLADNDPIFKSINNGGTIPERRLFRRWVTGQMFHHLATGNYTQSVHKLGYEYTWKQALEEYRVQAVLFAHKDNGNYAIRHRWFFPGVAVDMCTEYIKELYQYIEARKIKKYKGKPYKKIAGENILVEDIESRLINPLNNALRAVELAEAKMPGEAYNPQKFYHALQFFNSLRVKLPRRTRQSSYWIEAYKGCGAYYTLENMIRFHGARFEVGQTERRALDVLIQKQARIHACEGYRLLALLKKMIEDNGINIREKQKEWQLARQERYTKVTNNKTR